MSPCPFPALLQGGVQHIWPPGQNGWVAAIRVGGHEHKKYPICHDVLSLKWINNGWEENSEQNKSIIIIYYRLREVAGCMTVLDIRIWSSKNPFVLYLGCYLSPFLNPQLGFNQTRRPDGQPLERFPETLSHSQNDDVVWWPDDVWSAHLWILFESCQDVSNAVLRQWVCHYGICCSSSSPHMQPCMTETSHYSLLNRSTCSMHW